MKTNKESENTILDVENNLVELLKQLKSIKKLWGFKNDDPRLEKLIQGADRVKQALEAHRVKQALEADRVKEALIDGQNNPTLQANTTDEFRSVIESFKQINSDLLKQKVETKYKLLNDAVKIIAYFLAYVTIIVALAVPAILTLVSHDPSYLQIYVYMAFSIAVDQGLHWIPNPVRMVHDLFENQEEEMQAALSDFLSKVATTTFQTLSVQQPIPKEFLISRAIAIAVNEDSTDMSSEEPPIAVLLTEASDGSIPDLYSADPPEAFPLKRV